MKDYDMDYPYYDPPLKVPNALDPVEDKRASIDDIKRLNEVASANYDYHLAEVNYELRFGLSPWLTDWTEGPQYGQRATQHGGATAVLLECLKRDITVSRLWKIDDPLLEHPFVINDRLPTEEEQQEHIAKLKRWRKDILERKRQHRQNQ